MSRRLDPRAAAAVAVVLVGGTLAAILVFGRLSYPSFPSLQERPDPSVPGLVAYLHWDERGDDGACLYVVPASGEEPPRSLRCGQELSGQPLWSGGEVAVDVHDRAGVRRLWLDPSSGEVVREEAARDGMGEPPRPLPQGSSSSAAAGELRTRSRDGRVELLLRRGGAEQAVATASGPRDYHWWSAAWSPDGRYALVTDSAQRLLVVRVADGLVRLLAEDAGEGVWGRAR